jgi:TatA/E family protein of Tat protein translocase
MFGIGMPELLVILGVALIVVGPSKLPDLAKSLAKGLNEFRKATDEVKSTITEHESFKDLKDLKESVRGTVDSIKPSSLLDLEAKPAPEVTPVVEVKRFEAPSGDANPAQTPATATAGETAAADTTADVTADVTVDELVLEPKKPEENLAGRMAVLDSIVSEHQGADVTAAPAATPEKPLETAAPVTAPRANA